MPKFEQIFNDMLGDKPLPALTQFVISASNVHAKSLVLISRCRSPSSVIVYKMVARTAGGRSVSTGSSCALPLFGDLTRKSSISRFSRTLGTLVTSGVPILQALNITRETAGNSVDRRRHYQVHDAVKEGESIVAPLEASGVFPPMVI